MLSADNTSRKNVKSVELFQDLSVQMAILHFVMSSNNLENCVDPDQLASSPASCSEYKLYSKEIYPGSVGPRLISKVEKKSTEY